MKEERGGADERSGGAESTKKSNKKKKKKKKKKLLKWYDKYPAITERKEVGIFFFPFFDRNQLYHSHRLPLSLKHKNNQKSQKKNK